MTHERPPFRADHVGSLLRPPELLRAREQHQKGTLSAESLREIENRSIQDAAKLQEEIGLQAITDGEYRRTIWHVDFLRQIDGVRDRKSTRLNSSHLGISYAVFCLKKKKKK